MRRSGIGQLGSQSAKCLDRMVVVVSAGTQFCCDAERPASQHSRHFGVVVPDSLASGNLPPLSLTFLTQKRTTKVKVLERSFLSTLFLVEAFFTIFIESDLFDAKIISASSTTRYALWRSCLYFGWQSHYQTVWRQEILSIIIKKNRTSLEKRNLVSKWNPVLFKEENYSRFRQILLFWKPTTKRNHLIWYKTK